MDYILNLKISKQKDSGKFYVIVENLPLKLILTQDKFFLLIDLKTSLKSTILPCKFL